MLDKIWTPETVTGLIGGSIFLIILLVILTRRRDMAYISELEDRVRSSVRKDYERFELRIAEMHKELEEVRLENLELIRINAELTTQTKILTLKNEELVSRINKLEGKT